MSAKETKMSGAELLLMLGGHEKTRVRTQAKLMRLSPQCFNCPRRTTMRCPVCHHAGYCSRKCMEDGKFRHAQCCYPLDKKLIDRPANETLREALAANLFQEFAVLCNVRETCLNDFSKGRMLTYKGAIGLILMNPVNGDSWDDMTDDEEEKRKTFQEYIKEGGRLLNKDGGFSSMSDPLVFAFVPRFVRREIEMLWDGIGSWRS